MKRFQCIHQNVVEVEDRQKYPFEAVPPPVINTEVATVYADDMIQAINSMPDRAKLTLVQITLI